MSATDVFKRLGCPLPGIYSWAESLKGKRAAFTVWQDEVKRESGDWDRYLIYPTWERRPRVGIEVSVDNRPNALEMKAIAERAIDCGAECFACSYKRPMRRPLGHASENGATSAR